MVYDESTVASVYLGDFDRVNIPAPVDTNGGDRVVSYSVSNSRGAEQKAIKAITKALNDRDISMPAAGFFAAYEMPGWAQEQLLELFMTTIRAWCDFYDDGVETGLIDEKRKNYDVIVKAARIRDAMRTAGFWPYD